MATKKSGLDHEAEEREATKKRVEPVPAKVVPPSVTTVTVTVTVAEDCRWESIRSAGRVWTRTGEQINVADPDLPELRVNPFLTITEG